MLGHQQQQQRQQQHLAKRRLLRCFLRLVAITEQPVPEAGSFVGLACCRSHFVCIASQPSGQHVKRLELPLPHSLRRASLTLHNMPKVGQLTS